MGQVLLGRAKGKLMVKTALRHLWKITSVIWHGEEPFGIAYSSFEAKCCPAGLTRTGNQGRNLVSCQIHGHADFIPVTGSTTFVLYTANQKRRFSTSLLNVSPLASASFFPINPQSSRHLQ